MTLKEYIDNRGIRSYHIKRIMAALLYVKSNRTINDWIFRGVPIKYREELNRITHGKVTEFHGTKKEKQINE